MPTSLRIGPYRFFFYSADGSEPRHTHVERDDAEAKFWLEPIGLEYDHGFGSAEIRKIQKLIENRLDELLEAWNDHCG